jgi:type IX secretion system PorP/SprF family membrane protein
MAMKRTRLQNTNKYEDASYKFYPALKHNYLRMKQNRLNIIPHLIILLVLLVGQGFTTTLKSQQTPIYSQYTFSKFLINPAIAGAEGYTQYNLIAREQWIGLNDAPATHYLTAQTRLMKNNFISKTLKIRRKYSKRSKVSRVGLGAQIFNDRSGIFSRNGLQLTYAYHIDLRRSQLSFGLSAVAYQLTINENQINITDQLVQGNKRNIFVPDAGFGTYYMAENWYGGFSINQLIETSHKLGANDSRTNQTLRQYYFLGGYTFEINRDWEFEPSFLLKGTRTSSMQLDLTAKAIYREDYWGSLAYRTGNAIILSGGLKFDKYLFGYAFDYNLSAIGRYTYGSHEIMIAARFGDKARRHKWLNRR